MLFRPLNTSDDSNYNVITRQFGHQASFLFRERLLYYGTVTPELPRGVWPADAQWVRQTEVRVTFLALVVGLTVLMIPSLLFRSVREAHRWWAGLPKRLLRQRAARIRASRSHGFVVVTRDAPDPKGEQ